MDERSTLETPKEAEIRKSSASERMVERRALGTPQEAEIRNEKRSLEIPQGQANKCSWKDGQKEVWKCRKKLKLRKEVKLKEWPKKERAIKGLL